MGNVFNYDSLSANKKEKKVKDDSKKMSEFLLGIKHLQASFNFFLKAQKKIYTEYKSQKMRQKRPKMYQEFRKHKLKFYVNRNPNAP